MERCETCKWWMAARKIWNPDLVPNEGYCELTRMEQDYPVRVHPESKAHMSLGLGDMDNAWPIALITTPDFGCVQHGPREDAT